MESKDWTIDDERHYVEHLGGWAWDKKAHNEKRTLKRTIRLLNNYINRNGIAKDYAIERLMKLETEV